MRGLVLLLDVGPTMHNALPEIKKVAPCLFRKRYRILIQFWSLIYGKFDEVGVVVFGTQAEKEVGGYEHVVVLRNIKVVDGDLVDAFQELPRGNFDGDYLDAIVVGMDMLIKKYQATNKGKKRLCLITNALCPIKDSCEGTKEDQMGTIAAQMSAHGMKMENQIIMDENDRLLNIFSEKTSAKAVYVESPTALLVTIFRGDLELGSNMKIKVWVYKKTSEEKFPTLKKYSDKAPSTDRFATHEVKVDYEYKSVEDPNKVVPPEQRIKGYRYGPQVVPISSAEWDAVKFKPEKSVKLLGFTDASNIMRHYYMKDVNIFIPEPGNARAALAVSALARAMKEMNKVAILRCVWRQGQGSVVVGVLTPNISEKDSTPDSFYFNTLPFAEDVREFQFPSFSSFPASWQPNEQQQEAADNLVKMLDLAPSAKQEALCLTSHQIPFWRYQLHKFCASQLDRFYRHLELKSKHPDAVKNVIDAFSKSFELKENQGKLLLREKPSGSDEELRYQDATNVLAVKPVKVEKIGDSSPVQDFEAMMSHRDSPDWVSKAIQDMKNKINSLIENFYDGDNHGKALECLLALRKGCILEQEPKQFNDFLRHLFNVSQEKKLRNFYESLIPRGLTLISKSEAIDSEVTDDEARNFLVKKELKIE
ncbi:ATP-dependent DNA helicase [Salix suchowensis]|nr:ATP-dependent DNA helicase [Salix suchowensis]